MKILYVSRIFSGIKTSLENSNWDPTGVPTIYKMIDNLDKSNDVNLNLVFINREYIINNKAVKQFRNKKFKKINSKTTILSPFYLNYLNHFLFKKIINLINEFLYFFNLLLICKKFSPDLIYIDRSNIYQAALLSRLTSYKVFFRIMGIYPSMFEIFNNNNITNFILRICYKSPFNFILNTEDGTPGNKFLKIAINKNTKTMTMLNGINVIQKNIPVSKFNFPKSKFKILFLGRLIDYKGIIDFTNAMIDLLKIDQYNFHIIIAGYGPLEKEVHKIVKTNNFTNNFTFLKHISHREIYGLFKNIDLYISLNRLGNLSNANLEAINSETCIIVPESDKNNGRDTYLDKYMPDETIIRIPNNANEKEFIVDKCIKLFKSPEELKIRKYNTKKFAKKLLISWEKRIESEVKLIKKIIKNGKI